MANTGSVGQSPIPHWELSDNRGKKKALPDDNKRIIPVSSGKSVAKNPLMDKSVQKLVLAFKENDSSLLNKNYVSCQKKALDFAKIVSKAIKQLPSDEQEEGKSLVRDFFGNKLTQSLDAHDDKVFQVFEEVEASGENLIDFVANLMQFDDENKERLIALLGSYFENKIGVNPIKKLQEPLTAETAGDVQKMLHLCQKNQIPIHSLFEFCAEGAKETKKELFLLIEALVEQDVDVVQSCLKIKKDPLTHLEAALAFVPNPEFGKRLLLCTKALMSMPGERKPLSTLQSMKISLFVEKQLHQRSHTEKSKYVAKGENGLERALGFDFEHKAVFVFSKKAGELQKRGSEKKVNYAFKIGLEQAVPTVSRLARLVNIADDEIDHEQAVEIVESMKKEIQLERLFNDDVHILFEHANQDGKAKLTVVAEAYENDLEAYFCDKKEGYSEKLQLLQGVVAALNNIHQLGFVHDDLKAANIVIKVLPDGRVVVKIIDFGKTYNGLEYNKSDTFGYGSAFFSAPETFRPSLKLPDLLTQGKAEDMYALGCMLYSWIQGEEIPWAAEVGRAIEAPSDSMSQSAYQRQCDEHEKLKASGSSIQDPQKKQLFEICLKLLEPDPSKRLTLAELQGAL